MTAQFDDIYGFHTAEIRRIHHPELGPCIDVDNLTITVPDARQLADAITAAADAPDGR